MEKDKKKIENCNERIESENGNGPTREYETPWNVAQQSAYKKNNNCLAILNGGVVLCVIRCWWIIFYRLLFFFFFIIHPSHPQRIHNSHNIIFHVNTQSGVMKKPTDYVHCIHIYMCVCACVEALRMNRVASEKYRGKNHRTKHHTTRFLWVHAGSLSACMCV